jgi:hypothetical protein
MPTPYRPDRSRRAAAMRRAAVVIAFTLAACIGGEGSSPDAPNDTPSGSGSNAAMGDGFDPSPPDVTLEWIVVVSSTIVVGGSIRARRRRAKPYEI